MEEFGEADVLWPDDDRNEDDELAEKWHAGVGARRRTSGPVKVPSRPRSVRSWTPGFARAAASRDCRCNDDSDVDSNEEEDEIGGGKRRIVPPHVIVARRIADKMAFSVCVGNGRTLKGRDLSQVRNSILRMTGFLER